ncbi:MAG: TatD family hydrolase [bacterium]
MRARRSRRNPDGLNLFDSHCHLTDNQFVGDIKEVIRHAFETGVRELLVASQSVPDSQEVIRLCRGQEGLYCSVGVHPHEADGFRSMDVSMLKELCIEPSIRAIGEIGLDFFRNISTRSNQEVAFEAQVELARMMDLPMVLHVRDAASRVRAMLDEHGYHAGVLHCFSADAKMMDWAVERGYFISFAGNLTYDSRLTGVAGRVPLDRVMIESDAPYLAPEPLRGQRNEPAFVVNTVRCLAEIIKKTPREAAELTRDNARRCFRITD